MASLYIIHSLSLDKFYVGITTTSVTERLAKHNDKSYGKHYTSIANDWELKLEIACRDYSHARKLELYIKKMKSRVYILDLINSIEKQEDMKGKF